MKSVSEVKGLVLVQSQSGGQLPPHTYPVVKESLQGSSQDFKGHLHLVEVDHQAFSTVLYIISIVVHDVSNTRFPVTSGFSCCIWTFWTVFSFDGLNPRGKFSQEKTKLEQIKLQL